MKLIVGLGNPGKSYAGSRHNVGFATIKALAKIYGIQLKTDRGAFFLSGRGKIEGQNVILAIPLTFMNLSGIAVSALLKKYKLTFDNLLVICDDLDLEFARIKIRASGSSGGHRGIGSIIESLKSQDFPRLRIGIGRPRGDIDPAEYVLSGFNNKEQAKIKEAIGEAVDCCKAWLAKGVMKSMNIFNRRSK